MLRVKLLFKTIYGTDSVVPSLLVFKGNESGDQGSAYSIRWPVDHFFCFINSENVL